MRNTFQKIGRVFQKVSEIIYQNLANLVTTIGIILVVWLNVILRNGEPVEHLLVLLLSLGIWTSDLLDGWLSRFLGIVGSVGDFLDRFRDKFYFCSLYVYFLEESWCGVNGIWLAFIKSLIILILLIECFLMFIWFIGFIKGLDIKLHSSSKIKAAFCFIAISWWFFVDWLGELLQRELESYLYPVLILSLIGASIYGILSIVHYLPRFFNSPEE